MYKKSKLPNILVACEFSGRVRDAFIAQGYNAVSCDLLESEVPGPHIQGDVLPLLQWDCWDLIIAHPPCTYLCNSGVRWFWNSDKTLNTKREESMIQAAKFFKAFLDAKCPRVAVENPVMHVYAREYVGRKHDFTVQPWNFGDMYTKRTCFWTKGLSPLKPWIIVKPKHIEPKVHYESPGPNRWKNRSRTYPGIAKAMAEQWGPEN